MKNNGLISKSSNQNIYYCKEFINSYYTKALRYRGSELLSLGLSLSELDVALKRALTCCRSAGHPIQKHFLPIYTSYGDRLIRDCKLSKLAYALVVLNAPVQNPAIAAFQIKLLANYLGK